MKQLGFLVGILGLGFFGAFIAPFWALIPYYMFTILQPQHLWEWALPGDIRWSLIAAAIAVMGVGIHAGKLIERKRWPLIATLTLVYSLLVLISGLDAYDITTANMWSAVIFKITFIAMLTILVIHSMQHIIIFCAMVTVAMGILAWQFNSLYFFEGRMDILFKGLGSYDNNGASLLLAMGIPFAYAFAVAGRKMWQRVAAAGVAFFLIHAVMLSYSRGAMLAGLVGIIWLVFHHRPRKHAVVLGCVCMLAISFMAGKEIRDEFKSISEYRDDNSAISRLDSWEAAWMIVADHPWTGVGVRNSNIYSQNYGADRYGRTIHNLYLQTAADSGLPTLLVMLAIYAVVFRNLIIARTHIGRFLANPPPAATESADNEDASAPEKQTLINAELMERLIVAMQTSMIIFICGGTFLSLETFELNWLIVALAADLPYIVSKQLKLADPHKAARRKHKIRKPKLAEYSSPKKPLPA